MNYTFPAKVKNDMYRIAALKIEDKNLSMIRDLILIGYSYFLTPKQYMQVYNNDSKDGYLNYKILKGSYRLIFHLPIHPLISQMFEEYDDNLPTIDCFSIFPLYKQLFPRAKETRSSPFFVRMKSFTPPKESMLAETIEGLTQSQWLTLRGFQNNPKPWELDEIFKQPFFEPLRIRMKKTS